MYTALFADGISVESSRDHEATQEAMAELEDLGIPFEVQSLEEAGVHEMYAPGIVLVFPDRDAAQAAADETRLKVVDQTKERGEEGRRL